MEIRNFNHVRCDSNSRHTGGVLVFIKNNITFEVNEVHANDYKLWLLTLKIKLRYETIALTVLYRSPNSSVAEFLNYFQDWCSENCEQNIKLIIVGDFNINWNDQCSYTNKLKCIVNEAGMKQLVNEDTRITETSSTRIDLAISNDYYLKVSILRSPKLSDHDIISVQLNDDIAMNKIVRTNRNVNFSKLQENLICKNWFYNSTDVNVLYDKFEDNIISTLNVVSPVTRKVIRYGTNPWYLNEKLVQARKARDNAYKIFIITKSTQNWQSYKACRNKYVALFRKTKREYYKLAIDECKGNSLKMWKTLKQVISTKSTNNSDEIFFDNISEKEKPVIAEKFNQYFIKSINAIVATIPDTNFNTSVHICNKITFTAFSQITLKELRNIVFKQNEQKACTDEINWCLIRNTFDTVGYPLLHLINTSLEKGVIPDKLKISTVSPVPKIIGTKKANEYRPINMLPAVEKVIEIVVKNQLVNYLNTNKILAKEQSGFRDKHSCETAIQCVITNWKELLDNNETLIAVFLDLKRAFETIDRAKLLRKLEGYGISGIVLKWFTNYLMNRRQKTKFGSNISSMLECNVGVPQGSVLGPILFVIYINELPNILQHCSVQLFADDTLIYYENKNHNLLIEMLNSDLKIIDNWLAANKLKLNYDKTKCMVIGKQGMYNKIELESLFVRIGNYRIDYVDEIKYLGVVIDSKLTFKNHVHYIVKKIAKKISFMARISDYLSIETKILIFNTVVLPHFTYCNTILFLVNNECMDKLQKMQNRAMRVILKANRYSKIEYMLNDLNWLCIRDFIILNTMTFIYKILNNLTPEYLSAKIIKNVNVHSHFTRNRNDIHINRKHSEFAKNTIFDKGMVIFNDLDDVIKNASNSKIFKSKLKLTLQK